jgi:fructan beta-fructosidase
MRLLACLLVLCSLPAAERYAERFRPQFHFSPERNWTNDPCGLIYFRGEYHLFFQYNPQGELWGHMSWGHATSRDLIHWAEQPVAIPEGDGVMIFTGSSVEQDRHIASIWTGHLPKTANQPGRQHQNLAFSEDGRTWKKFPGNPVLDIGMADFRDPKVLWHAPTRRWIMLVMLPNEFKARFYGSEDLKRWTMLSEFGPAGANREQWECPDIYELPVDGNPENTRWVLKIGNNPGHVAGGSGEQYFVGRFDGTRFVNDNPPEQSLWVDYGRDCYCEFSFTNAPAPAAPVAMGWMSDWLYASKTPTSPWRGQMTIPRELSLETTPAGIRLVQKPARMLTGLREARTTKLDTLGDTFELSTEVAADRPFRLSLAGAELGYDPAAKQIWVDRTKGNVPVHASFPVRTVAPVALAGKVLTLRVFVDRSSIEVFADGGRVTLTNLVYPEASRAPAIAEGTPLRIEAWRLKSIWK